MGDEHIKLVERKCLLFGVVLDTVALRLFVLFGFPKLSSLVRSLSGLEVKQLSQGNGMATVVRVRPTRAAPRSAPKTAPQTTPKTASKATAKTPSRAPTA